jgi:predicted nucleic-acid-binding Zn-ribbon protein
MMTKCPQCGSSEIISDLIVFAQGHTAGGQPIYVTMIEPEPEKRPFVWLPKTEMAGFRVAVCGECGHAELYTNSHKELLAAYKKGFVSQQNV